MKATLLKSLVEKDMQAMVEKLTLNDYYYPSLFPLEATGSLTWKSLMSDTGIPVAADVVASGSSVPRKTRDVVSKLTGNIPKIAIARDMEEDQINELLYLQQMASNASDVQALIKKVYDDIEFCFNGVNAKLEYIALQAISTGKATFTNTNNQGIVSAYDVDFQVPTAQKTATSITWATSATATPIKDIQTIVKKGRKSGRRYKYILMNQDTFDNMVATAEVQKFAANFISKITETQDKPTLTGLNFAMNNNGLPEIKIIESFVQLEIDSARTTVNCFYDGIVTFVTDMVQGKTYHAKLAEESINFQTGAFLAKRGHILVKKYVKEEPITESTLAMANAFPGWGMSQTVHLFRTDGTSWVL